MKGIRATFPNGVREFKAGGTWQNIAGQPTDDSEMALSLTRMRVRERRGVRFKSGSILGSWLVHASANMAMCLSVAIRTAA